ncbi:MAG: radical SAM/SPASM domain protein, ACGX system [Marinifilaceae bacterium]
MAYFAFQWHITEACDQRCKHCYIYALGSHAKFKEMTLPSMKKVIDACKTMCKKSGRDPYFYITGGDPILHPQFWELAELMKNNKLPYAILGNPFHLTDEVCERLRNTGCVKYQLSLDGLQETHDSIRRPGSYKETLAAIAPLKRAGITVAIMATVSKLNHKEIPRLTDVAVEWGADIFAFARYCPSKEDRDSCCTPSEYKEMMQACWDRFQYHKESNTYFSFKDHLWTLFMYEKGLFKIDATLDAETIYAGCNCANSHLTILPDGDIYACRRMESNVGNVFTDDMWNVFTGNKMEAYRNYDKFEKCSKCELLRFCRGCPAVAYGYHGNSYAPDPQCWKQV